MDAVEQFIKNPYDTLDDLFTSFHSKVLEIEVVPSDFLPPDTAILQDGHCIGVTKKFLVQAFIIARKLFNETNLDPSKTTLSSNATRVILLYDPEYLTAANYRKTILNSRRSAATTSISSSNSLPEPNITCYHAAVVSELAFLDSILTSPLHRQSKSPTLWYHRFWVVSTWVSDARGSSSTGSNAHSNTSISAPNSWPFQPLTEILAVCKAGERHPKNYYAWLYARRLIQLIFRDSCLSDASSNGSNDDPAAPEIFDTVVDAVQAWCTRHVSDISGWMFLFFLLERQECMPNRRVEVVGHIVDLTLSLGWLHESLWTFLQSCLVSTAILPERNRKEFTQRVHEMATKTHIPKTLLPSEGVTSSLQQVQMQNTNKRIIEIIEITHPNN